MKRGSWAAMAAAAVAATAMLLAGCAETASDDHEVVEPVVLESAGADLMRITLTEHAAERLDIRQHPSRPRAAARSSRRTRGSCKTTAACGSTSAPSRWCSSATDQHRVRRRHPRGPDGRTPPGTQVVTVGVPELLGAESEIGH